MLKHQNRGNDLHEGRVKNMSWKRGKYFWGLVLFLLLKGIQTDEGDVCNVKSDECKKLVIVDTDTAVDDAMGLVMLLSNPGWKVIAITSVFGNVDVDLATTNIMRTLNTMKRKDIPIYKGAATPLVRADFRSDYHGVDGLSGKGGNYPVGDLKVESEAAANALVRLVKEHPGQVTILTLGPLTNLAMAQRFDSQFLKNVQRVVIMGGNVNGTGNLDRGDLLAAEYNFAQDPESVQIVISESTVKPEIYTWELCQEGGVSWDVYDKMVSSNSIASRFIKDISSTNVNKERNIGHAPRMSSCCCDFFAVISLVNPKSVKQLTPRFAAVELNGKFTRGMMVVDKNSHTTNVPNVNIISQVDSKEIEKSFMQMANGK